MPIRLHTLTTYHIWLVVQKYAAPGTEFLTSILDNLVKINNLYPLTICHNPVANMQKKITNTNLTNQSQGWYKFLLCQLQVGKDLYMNYFCHSYSSPAVIPYAM